MAKKTPPYVHYPTWTTARFWSFVRSALRAAYRRWPPRYEVLGRAKRKARTGSRHKWEFKCGLCSRWFKQSEIEVDHLTPAGELREKAHLPAFVERLFCGVEGLQVVCKPCHKKKTAKERKIV